MTGPDKKIVTGEKRISFVKRLKLKMLYALRLTHQPVVHVYNGYGHATHLMVFGHVFDLSPLPRKHYSSNIFTNTFALLRMFMVRPTAGAKVRMVWGERTYDAITESDGFFRFEWQPEQPVDAGWHAVTVHLLANEEEIISSAQGHVLVPHDNDYSFISDID